MSKQVAIDPWYFTAERIYIHPPLTICEVVSSSWMPSRQSSSVVKLIEMDPVSCAETQTIASLESASTVTVCDTTTSAKLPAQLLISLPSIANARDTQERDLLASQYIKALEDLVLAQTGQEDNAFPVIELALKDETKKQQHQEATSETTEQLFVELLSCVRAPPQTRADRKLHIRIWDCIFACVIAKHMQSLIKALLSSSTLAEVGEFLNNFSKYHGVTALNHEVVLKLRRAGLKNTPLDGGQDAFDDFLTDVLRPLCTCSSVENALWPLRDSVDSDSIRTIFTCPLLRDLLPLSFLFHKAHEQRTALPERFPVLFTYFAFATWPSLTEMEDSHFRQLPLHRPSSVLFKLLCKLAKSNPDLLEAFINRLVAAIRVDANFQPTQAEIADLDCLNPDGIWNTEPRTLSSQPVIPYLWMATYLVQESEAVAHTFISRGLVTNLREMYELDFPHPASHTPLSSHNEHHDLQRLTYLLLRVLSRPGVVRMYSESDRAIGQLKDLKEELNEDVRMQNRMISERYHFWCPWDEIEAEKKDRLWLESDAEKVSQCAACRRIHGPGESHIGYTCPHISDYTS